jgi:hypothetical protein
MAKAKPECLSLLVADSIRQERNGKLFLIGVYTNVKLTEKPNPGSLFIHAILRSIPQGSHELSISVIDLKNEKQMITNGPPFDSPSPKNLIPLAIEIEDFSFPSSGSYVFQLLLDDKPLGEHIVSITFPEADVVEEKPTKTRRPTQANKSLQNKMDL